MSIVSCLSGKRKYDVIVLTAYKFLSKAFKDMTSYNYFCQGLR